MSEFEDKLNAILSNPEAMAQVAGLAQSLGLNGPPQGGQAQGDPPPQEPQGQSRQQAPGGPADHPGGPDLSGLGSLLGGIDPGMLQRLLPLLGELQGDSASDERMALLRALAPFLRPERREKVERAAKTAHLLHVGKKLLTSLGGGHV